MLSHRQAVVELGQTHMLCTTPPLGPQPPSFVSKRGNYLKGIREARGGNCLLMAASRNLLIAQLSFPALDLKTVTSALFHVNGNAAQRGEVTCPCSHSVYLAEPGLGLIQPTPGEDSLCISLFSWPMEPI